MNIKKKTLLITLGRKCTDTPDGYMLSFGLLCPNNLCISILGKKRKCWGLLSWLFRCHVVYRWMMRSGVPFVYLLMYTFIIIVVQGQRVSRVHRCGSAFMAPRTFAAIYVCGMGDTVDTWTKIGIWTVTFVKIWIGIDIRFERWNYWTFLPRK